MFEIDDIVRLRKQLGLTQTELAKLSGVSQSLITKMEAKKVEPAYSKVKILIETLQKQERRDGDKRTAKSICSKTVKGIDKKETLKDAAKKIREKNISQLPVFDKSNIIGSLSEKTILRELSESGSPNEAFAKKVIDVMDPPFPTVDANTPVELLYQMLEFYEAVVVTEKAKVIGIVTRSDLFKLK
ncbi:MAG: CBS domain-containing protein [Nitrososphaerales archaeon]|nr:CBS domain-containing protein [Nitrososphaerales archaeon]